MGEGDTRMGEILNLNLNNDEILVVVWASCSLHWASCSLHWASCSLPIPNLKAWQLMKGRSDWKKTRW